MSPKQKKLAAKAPPPDVFNEKDLAVLRAEKAKGRGMGLQDEKVQPGKVMKAKMGVATDYKKYLKGLKKATDSVKKDKDNKFIKRRKELMEMPKLSSGGVSSKEVYTNARANVDAKGKKNMTMNDLKEARRETYATKKMGGGMMQKPMGYSKGVSVKARGCKLGRTKPTKIT